MTDQPPCHAVAVNICTPDRGKVTFHWFISKERAHDLIAELTERIGAPDHEFMATAEHIDMVTRELFKLRGGPIMHVRDEGHD